VQADRFLGNFRRGQPAQIEIFGEAGQCCYGVTNQRGRQTSTATGDDECRMLDEAGAKVMSRRLMEAGEIVPEEEIIRAVLALRRAAMSQDGGRGVGYSQFGVFVEPGNSRKFRLWRDMGVAGIVDTETGGGMRISLESHLLEGTRLVRTQIPGTLDGGWDPHDTPCGGAAITTVKMSGLDGKLRGGFVWKESHYSFGRRWDPSADRAAANYYFPNGALKCRQRFHQGASCTGGDIPVFEGFYPDGTPRAVEYGDSQRGRHRPVNLGPAYQEFHPDGSPALIVFAENGVQRGKALRFSPGGEKIEGGKETIDCGSITNGEGWVLRDETPAKPKGLGEALTAAAQSLSGKGGRELRRRREARHPQSSW